MRAEEEAAAFELDGEDGARTTAPDFWLTMICSPCFSPRLESGSSGTMVSDRGGYPDLTATHLRFHVPHEMTTGMGRTYSPEEMAVSAIQRRFLAAGLVL